MLPRWPVVALLLAYPVWWALGLGVLIFPILAVPMAVALLRAHATGRPARLPPGFALWALFLVVLVAGIAVLGVDPPGTVPGTAGGRLLAVLFRLGQYLSLTVLLVYTGNLTEAELSRHRLVRLLGWLFVVTVAGGLLGVSAGDFEFTSPVEWLLPAHVRQDGFVQSLVHPYAAQVMDILGPASPRPAAPWGYTNTWGNNFCLLVVWFVVAAWGAGRNADTAPAPGGLHGGRTGGLYGGRPAGLPGGQIGGLSGGRIGGLSGGRPGRRARVLAVVCLAVAVIPVVLSLNRGLWIGLGVAAGYVAIRMALHGRLWAIGALGLVAAALATALAVTPLGTVVGERLDNGKSNGVRMYVTQRALAGLASSPVVGFGSTRNTLGGRNSITVGESSGCERCGNFTIGGNGQLWQLMYAHGLTGTAAYLGFFGYGMWRFRRDRSAIGIAGSTAILGSFAAMFWYNALVTPLAFTFFAYALLWRNDETNGGVHR